MRISGIAMLRRRVVALMSVCVIGVACVVTAPTAQAQVAVVSPGSYATITNDQFYTDTNGDPIYSQGGGIFDFTDPATGQQKHYWYGVHYAEAEQYRDNPTSAITSGNTFLSVDAYSSTDLVNWKPEGAVLTRAEVTSHDVAGSALTQWVGRTGVAYLPSIGKYALLIQHETGPDASTTDSKKVLIATADSPVGPFTYDRLINMKDYGLGTTNTGDQSVFQDTDGTGYLVYSYGSGRSKQWVAQIGVNGGGKVDLLNPTMMYNGNGREGNTMFTYDGRYYLVASDLFGWDSSRIHYLVSDNVWGPYTPTNQTLVMDGSREDFGHVSQTGFYYTVHGSTQDTVIHCGDRWAEFAGNGIGYNEWDPLTMDTDGTPHFNSLSQWNLNASTGEWTVGTANNYVLNGAFEADRTKAPYQDKDSPKGDIPNIAGWESNDLAVAYNGADKDGRVGNFNLTFWSSSAYSATVSQTIAPTRFALPDGSYTLRAQVKKSAVIRSATLSAASGGATFTYDLGAIQNSDQWRSISLPVTVSSGNVRVAVSVDGDAGQSLKMDDFELVPNIDKGPLNSGILAAEGKVEGHYTVQSWLAFAQALSEARAVNDDGQAMQDRIDAALQTLVSSSAALEPTSTDMLGGSMSLSAGGEVEFTEPAAVAGATRSIFKLPAQGRVRLASVHYAAQGAAPGSYPFVIAYTLSDGYVIRVTYTAVVSGQAGTSAGGTTGHQSSSADVRPSTLADTGMSLAGSIGVLFAMLAAGIAVHVLSRRQHR